MKRHAAILIAVVVLAVSGLVHGFWSRRWAASTVLQEAAARVDNVPLTFGDWQGESLAEDPSMFYQTGAQRFWTRSYVHTQKKTSLLVILMCGRAGRMAVHTPEVCYRGAGYELDGQPKVMPVVAATEKTWAPCGRPVFRRAQDLQQTFGFIGDGTRVDYGRHPLTRAGITVVNHFSINYMLPKMGRAPPASPPRRLMIL